MGSAVRGKHSQSFLPAALGPASSLGNPCVFWGGTPRIQGQPRGHATQAPEPREKRQASLPQNGPAGAEELQEKQRPPAGCSRIPATSPTPFASATYLFCATKLSSTAQPNPGCPFPAPNRAPPRWPGSANPRAPRVGPIAMAMGAGEVGGRGGERLVGQQEEGSVRVRVRVCPWLLSPSRHARACRSLSPAGRAERLGTGGQGNPLGRRGW